MTQEIINEMTNQNIDKITLALNNHHPIMNRHYKDIPESKLRPGVVIKHSLWIRIKNWLKNL